MTIIQWINIVIASLGVPKIAGALIYIGKKLQLLQSLNVSLEKIKHNIKVMSDYLTRHHIKFDPSLEFLKVFFYNNPDRNLENTAPTLGVYVRDKYLEKHPEITQ